MTSISNTDPNPRIGCFLALLMLAYGIVQIYAGMAGILHHCGSGWAIAAFMVLFLFRFSLPLTIGSFFGAMNVWGWHWLGALLFAAPGLVFVALMIPGVLTRVMVNIKKSGV